MIPATGTIAAGTEIASTLSLSFGPSMLSLVQGFVLFYLKSKVVLGGTSLESFVLINRARDRPRVG